jgi:hypothetical protein
MKWGEHTTPTTRTIRTRERRHEKDVCARYLKQAPGVLLLGGGAGDKGAVELLLQEEERVAPLHDHVHARHEPTFGPHRSKADRKHGPGRGEGESYVHTRIYVWWWWWWWTHA